MNEQIKQRIEEINQGIIPVGYKNTKNFGIIPVNLKTCNLGKLINFYTEKTTEDNQFPMLTSARNGIVFQAEYFMEQVTTDENTGYNIIPRGYLTYRSRSDDGSFVFNQNDIVDIGTISYFYPVFCVNNNANQYFVLNYMNNFFKRQIVREIVGTSQLVLSEKKLASLQIPYPPIPEQQKIADILTTCDKVITLKKQLIAEKEKQKNG